jgi:PadR family transcriptional regulator PadR
MDIQLKRGLLEVCVLAAIRNEDSYGYKIIKDMSPYLEMSESTLYTILKRLEGAELLTVRSAEHGGRLRKYYHITPQGRDRIEEFRDDWKEIEAIYRFITRETEQITAPTDTPQLTGETGSRQETNLTGLQFDTGMTLETGAFGQNGNEAGLTESFGETERK